MGTVQPPWGVASPLGPVWPPWVPSRSPWPRQAGGGVWLFPGRSRAAV